VRPLGLSSMRTTAVSARAGQRPHRFELLWFFWGATRKRARSPGGARSGQPRRRLPSLRPRLPSPAYEFDGLGFAGRSRSGVPCRVARTRAATHTDCPTSPGIHALEGPNCAGVWAHERPAAAIVGWRNRRDHFSMTALARGSCCARRLDELALARGKGARLPNPIPRQQIKG
jgi:hypothetical protein